MNAKLRVVLLAACVAGLVLGATAPARAGVSDAWVSTKVKMELMNSPQVSGYGIDVDTDDGRVTLHGKVPTTSEKTEAGRIAKAGTGVVSVRNLLQVVPASRRHQVAVADERLESDVAAALKAEPALSNSSISTKSVNKGVVLLQGKAASLSDHLLALEVAAAVPGVHRVASEIDSPNEFADREIWTDETPTDKPAGNAITDGWITAEIKMKFMTDAEITSGDIHVDSRRGVVTLFGTVPSSANSAHAVSVARNVSGVHSVKNELRVVPAAKRKQVLADDDAVATAVRRRIDDAKMDGAHVTVDVKGATARLSGTVANASHRYATVAIAHDTPGVARVQNDLRVESAKDAPK